MAKVRLWLFALAMAYPYLPAAHTEAFKGASVMAGLMISLGASNLVGQAGAGLKPPCRTSIPSTGLSARRFPASRARALVLGSLHASIQDMFNEHGVRIMSPHCFRDPAESKPVPQDRWFTRPAWPPRP